MVFTIENIDKVLSPPTACAAKLLPLWEDITKVPCEEDGLIENVSPEEHRIVSCFQEFSKPHIKCDPILGRKFLRHAMACTSLFKGDGYVYDENGQRGFKEDRYI